MIFLFLFFNKSDLRGIFNDNNEVCRLTFLTLRLPLYAKVMEAVHTCCFNAWQWPGYGSVKSSRERVERGETTACLFLKGRHSSLARIKTFLQPPSIPIRRTAVPFKPFVHAFHSTMLHFLARHFEKAVFVRHTSRLAAHACSTSREEKWDHNKYNSPFLLTNFLQSHTIIFAAVEPRGHGGEHLVRHDYDGVRQVHLCP